MAQNYRAAMLYEGPMEDLCGQAIKNCDKNGPLMIFISKTVIVVFAKILLLTVLILRQIFVVHS